MEALYNIGEDVDKLSFTCGDVMVVKEQINAEWPGADPEILHGRWLTGWPPIVNYTGARGVAG